MLILPNLLDHLGPHLLQSSAAFEPTIHTFFISICHPLQNPPSLLLKFQVGSSQFPLLAPSTPDFNCWGTHGSIFGTPLCLHSPPNTQYEFVPELSGGLVKTHITELHTQSFWFNQSREELENLDFYQVTRCYCHCYSSMDNTLKAAALHDFITPLASNTTLVLMTPRNIPPAPPLPLTLDL